MKSGKSIHFGYDYYMYIGVSRWCGNAISKAEKNGLFVELTGLHICEVKNLKGDCGRNFVKPTLKPSFLFKRLNYPPCPLLADDAYLVLRYCCTGVFNVLGLFCPSIYARDR